MCIWPCRPSLVRTVFSHVFWNLQVRGLETPAFKLKSLVGNARVSKIWPQPTFPLWVLSRPHHPLCSTSRCGSQVFPNDWTACLGGPRTFPLQFSTCRTLLPLRHSSSISNSAEPLLTTPLPPQGQSNTSFLNMITAFCELPYYDI